MCKCSFNLFRYGYYLSSFTVINTKYHSLSLIYVWVAYFLLFPLELYLSLLCSVQTYIIPIFQLHRNHSSMQLVVSVIRTTVERLLPFESVPVFNGCDVVRCVGMLKQSVLIENNICLNYEIVHIYTCIYVDTLVCCYPFEANIFFFLSQLSPQHRQTYGAKCLACCI